MTTEQLARLVTRIQIKDILRRQADIRPEETMFDGVYAVGSRPVPTTASIGERLAIMEKWLDEHPSRSLGLQAQTRAPERRAER